jgi:hypothetical protein
MCIAHINGASKMSSLDDLRVNLTMAKAHLNSACEVMNLTDDDTMTQAIANRGPRAGSFNAQIQELNPGECVSKVRPVDPTLTIARIPDELPSLRQQVRNAVTPAVTRAREATGNTYSIEVGDLQMPNGSLYVVAVVTRVNI